MDVDQIHARIDDIERTTLIGGEADRLTLHEHDERLRRLESRSNRISRVADVIELVFALLGACAFAGIIIIVARIYL